MGSRHVGPVEMEEPPAEVKPPQKAMHAPSMSFDFGMLLVCTTSSGRIKFESSHLFQSFYQWADEKVAQ